MEVSLVEADGIPEGCIVSVRAGTTRRQAPVEAGKPCKLLFPKGVSYANPFKVDLLAPLGDTTFEVNNASERYPFEVKSRYGGKSMRITLRVREDSGAAARPDELDGLHSVRQSIGESLNASCAGETPARRHQAAIEQRAYFDSHNLLSWVHDLLQDLARDRPEDPWNYIDASTASARQKFNCATAAASSAPSTPRAAMQEDLELLRSVTREVLTSSATSGKLENALKRNEERSQAKALQQSKAPSADQPAQQEDVLRSRAKAALTSGNLANALHQSKVPSADQPAKEEDVLRSRAKAALTSGNLANALLQSKAPSADQPAQAEDVLRSRAKAALTSGNLANALLQSKAPSADQPAQAMQIEDQLRKRAVEALLKRGRPGLSKALSRKAGAPNEDLRCRALLELLAAPVALRDKARQLLSSAAASGSLQLAIEATAAKSRQNDKAVVAATNTSLSGNLEQKNQTQALTSTDQSRLASGRPASLEGLTSTSVAAEPAVAPAVAPSKPGEISAGILRHSNSSSVLKTPLAPLPTSPGATDDARHRFKQQNEALRRENVRLKRLREAGDAANTLCSENDRLRSELGKLFSLHKKDTRSS